MFKTGYTQFILKRTDSACMIICHLRPWCINLCIWNSEIK